MKQEHKEIINSMLDYNLLIFSVVIGLLLVSTGFYTTTGIKQELFMIASIGYLMFSVAYGTLMQSWQKNKELKVTIEILEPIKND